MNRLRNHWYDLGGFLSLPLAGWLIVCHSQLTSYQLLMWIHLITLFLHQLEEYRIVGTFPGMMNRVMYKSAQPDRYPLNTHTSLVVNVVVGWGTYLSAALLSERAIWLGLATILVSAGNIIAHTLLFNIKGKTLYNAGMATSILLFLPVCCCFFYTVNSQQLIRPADYLIGIPLGLVLNVAGILKMIDWLKDRDTKFGFPQRCLLPEDRNNILRTVRRKTYITFL